MAEEKKYKYKCEMCSKDGDNAEEFRKCMQCHKYICEECIIAEDVCPYCAPRSLEDVEE